MEEKPRDGFRRKVYTKMYHSSISALQQDQEKPKKKILPTGKKTGLREEFKKTFLPHLIDIFELRQMVRNYKKEKESPSVIPTKIKSPKEVLEKLQQLQDDVEEAQRWCTGMILQISEAIEEAKGALENLEPFPPSPQKYSIPSSLRSKLPLWQRLFSKKR